MFKEEILILSIVFCVFLIFFTIPIIAPSQADPLSLCYNVIGSGVCEAPGNCLCITQALNDNTNCYSKVMLTGDIPEHTGICVNNPVNFNNKILDCQGHVIDGDDTGSDYGIYISGKSGNTIRDCVVTDFWRGILLDSSSNNNIITNNTANSNTNYGISVRHSSNNNTITENTASGNHNGIHIWKSSEATITYNNASSNNQGGIKLYYSSNNHVENNTANSNKGHGVIVTWSHKNKVINNTANSNKYGVILEVDSDYNVITDNDANFNTGQGVSLYHSSSNNIVKNNNANSNGWQGILLADSSNNNIVTDNNANSNVYQGILVTKSSINNNMTNNTANYNQRFGLLIADSLSSINIINMNTFCWNNQSGGNYYDLSDVDSNQGDENTCDTVQNWNDSGTTGCTYPCAGCIDKDGDDFNVTGVDCGPVDCNDSNAAVNPGETEVCNNGIDDDCDGFVDCDDPDCDSDPNCVGCGYWEDQQSCLDADCHWCDDCDIYYIFNGANQCVDSFLLCSYNGCDVDTCGAECDPTHPCEDKCIGDVYHYNGNCLGDCSCEYDTKDCDKDGWNDTGSRQWVDTVQCTEKEQKQQEYRDYACSSDDGCVYQVTGHRWVDTGVTRNKPLSTPCEADGDFCTVDHCDGHGNCVYREPYDCSSWDLPEIAQCDYDPDSYLPTFDYTPPVPGACDEVNDECIYDTQLFSHTCADPDDQDGGPDAPATRTRTCTAGCDGYGTECQPRMEGDYCEYDGICDTDPTACSCVYDSREYCPEPGTVVENVCYYGRNECDENGCGIMSCPLEAEYSVCDPEDGCINCIPAGTIIDSFSNGNSSFQVKLNGIEPEMPGLLLPPGYVILDATMRVTGLPIEIATQKAADITIVDDVSGSMDDDCGPDKRAQPGEHPCKINDKKDADMEFINLVLGEGMSSKIGLVAYSSNVVDSVPLTDDNETLINHVNSYNVSGDTCISCGINESINLTKEGTNLAKAIILMSDGMANECMYKENCRYEEAKQEAIDMARDAWEKYRIRVFAIAFGNDSDTATMLEIANVGNGTYYFADNLNITEIHRMIINEIFSSYPYNAKADIGNDSVIDWSHPGVFNTSEYFPDFSAALNDFLECTCPGCTPQGGECLVGIYPESDMDGILLFDEVNITGCLFLENVTDSDNDGYNSTVDCDDNDPNTHPDAPERCDGLDNDDCDGSIDEGGVCEAGGRETNGGETGRRGSFTGGATTQYCGNGVCTGNENCSTCPQDCGECLLPGDENGVTATARSSGNSTGDGEVQSLKMSPDESSCTESWSCTEWSPCQSDATQARVCTDANKCRTTENKPAESRSCGYTSAGAGISGFFLSNPAIGFGLVIVLIIAIVTGPVYWKKMK